jgi:hypothetical protein
MKLVAFFVTRTSPELIFAEKNSGNTYTIEPVQ